MSDEGWTGLEMKLSFHHKASGEQERRLGSGDTTWGPAPASPAARADGGTHPSPSGWDATLSPPQRRRDGGGGEPAASLPPPLTVSVGHDSISKASHRRQSQAGSWIPATQLLGDLCSTCHRLEGTAEVRASLILITWTFQIQLKAFSLSFAPTNEHHLGNFPPPMKSCHLLQSIAAERW